MLYDVLPPFILFSSFGGIILLVSRVLMRMKRQQVSQEIQSHASEEKTMQPEKVFNPGAKGIKLVRTRLALIPQAVSSTVTQTREALEERRKQASAKKEEKAKEAQEKVPSKQTSKKTNKKEKQEERDRQPGSKVTIPQSGWREKLSGVAEKSKTGITSFKSTVTEKAKPGLSAVKERAQRIPSVKTKTLDLEEEEERKASESEKPNTVSRLKVVRQEEQPNPNTRKQKQMQQQSSAQAEKTEAKEQNDSQASRIVSRLLHKDESSTKEKQTPIQQAQAALENANYDQVEDILLSYIMQHTKDAKAYMLLGKAAIGRGAWDEAVEVFEQVKKIHGEYPGVNALLGHAAKEAGKFTLAVQALQRARDEEPENIEIREQLLAIAQRMDNKVLEKSVTEELEELNPQPKETTVKETKVHVK